MHFFQAISTALLLGSAVASFTPKHLVLHEKRASAPAQWSKRSEAPRSLTFPVRVAISSRNADLGHDAIMDIADPKSPNFGKHWTAKEVHDFFAPDLSTMSRVKSWLTGSGIDSSRLRIHGSRGQIVFNATVDEMESLLGTQYHLYEDVNTGDLTVSCDEYHVPGPLRDHIDFISPTIGFSKHSVPALRKRSLKKRSNGLQMPTVRRPVTWALSDVETPTNCSGLVTPACIKALYGLPANNTSVEGNDLGIFECGDFYDQEDLNDFFTTYYPSIPNGTHPTLDSIDGGEAPVPVEDAGGESTLDFELAFPIVYPQNIQLYQTLDEEDSFSTDGIFNPFLDALDGSYCTFEGGDNKTVDPTFPSAGYNHSEQCGVFKPTNVISLSYALAEGFYSPAYEVRQCEEYMKLGLQGTSFVFASGDNGTVARAGLQGCLEPGDRFNPNFPATCPYVTTVGGTQVAPGASTDETEVAVFVVVDGEVFTSGGGFANNFAQPSYQSEAVSTYLATAPNLPPAGVFNASGRGFPDVSANSWPTATFLEGEPFMNGGTSAATPIFASIITLINGQRILAGKGPIGFLNPTLYANPDAFNDVTEGYNVGCTLDQGFNATAGWDPVTGLGTPKYQALLDVFMALP